MKPYTLQTTGNGLEVLTVPRSGTEAVTVQFLFRGGSRYEDKRTNGLAHFNEHMAFKGSKRYSDFRAVSEAFDRIGAINNAFTGPEVVGYWAKTPAEHALSALDVLSDMLTTPRYDADALNRERGVIVEEINMYEDDPAGSLYELLEETLYPDQPLGRSTLGPKQNIRTFTPRHFHEFTKKHLTPDRGLLVLAGQVGKIPAAKLKAITDRFGGRSSVKAAPARVTQTKPVIKVKHKKTEQTHLAVALRGPSMQDRDKSLTLNVLANFLGGTMSSRLFIEVRERRGLAYYVRAMPYQYTDVGNLVITAGVTTSKLREALGAIITELKGVRDGNISKEELSIAKESLKGRMALRWEDSSAVAGFYGDQQLLLGEIMSTTEVLKRIERVTADDLIALAGELVNDAGLNVAVIGPHKQSEFAAGVTFG